MPSQILVILVQCLLRLCLSVGASDADATAIRRSATSEAALEHRFTPEDEVLLDEVQRACFLYFWHETGTPAKLAKDRKKAPVSSIARAIELGDVKFLRSLPGVGAAKARDIVNSLRGKMAEFAGMDEAVPVAEGAAEPSTQSDAIEVLIQLGHTAAEARHRVMAALTGKPDIITVDALVAEALSDRG